MRIAAIYDIHANLPALEAVLRVIEQKKVEMLIVGGDVVAGPMPVETLTRLQSLPIPTKFIRGNAESEVLRCLAGQTPNGLSPRADEEAHWLASILPPAQQAFIATWPATFTVTVPEWGSILFCHATPDSDIRVFTEMTPEANLRPFFSHLTTSLVVCGHTHMPFNRHIGPVRVVNAGSVGMPFGRTGADWLLIDGDVQWQHTDYALASAAEQIRQTNYPHADAFASGNILNAPTKADALAMLTHLEAQQQDNRTNI